MHSKRRKRIGLVILLTCFLFNCGTALYIPKENIGISKGDLSEMIKGRSAYIKKCGNCHALVLPEKHSAGEWRVWVEKMSLKVNLTATEQAEILKYLTKNDSSALSLKTNKARK